MIRKIRIKKQAFAIIKEIYFSLISGCVDESEIQNTFARESDLGHTYLQWYATKLLTRGSITYIFTLLYRQI